VTPDTATAVPASLSLSNHSEATFGAKTLNGALHSDTSFLT